MAVKELIKENGREVKDVGYLILLQGLTYVVPLLVLPYLMQTLGPEKYGYIGFSLAIVQYMMLIVDFGFNQSATKRVAIAMENKPELNKIFSATVYSKLLLLASCFILMLLISLIPEFRVYRATMFVMFITVIGQTFIFTFLFQGLGKIKWLSIINAIAKLSILPLTFIFVKHEEDFLIAALIQSFVSVAAAVVSMIVVHKKHWVSLLRPDMEQIKGEMKESLPLFVSTAATSIYTACYAIILGYFATPYEVGLYTSSDRIIRAVTFMFLAPVIQVFYPLISRIGAADKQKAVSLYSKISIITITVMAVFAVCVFCFAPWAIDFLRDDFHDAGRILQILAVIPVLISIGGIAGQLSLLAIGGDKEKSNFRNTYVIAAIVALVGVFALSPLYGAVGAAVAIVVTEGLVGVMMSIYSAKFIKGLKE